MASVTRTDFFLCSVGKLGVGNLVLNVLIWPLVFFLFFFFIVCLNFLLYCLVIFLTGVFLLMTVEEILLTCRWLGFWFRTFTSSNCLLPSIVAVSTLSWLLDELIVFITFTGGGDTILSVNVLCFALTIQSTRGCCCITILFSPGIDLVRLNSSSSSLLFHGVIGTVVLDA